MQPLFEITDVVDLSGLGFDKGSCATVSLSLTRKWQMEWAAIFETKREEKETDTEYNKRLYAQQYDLAAEVVKSITIKKGKERWERSPITAADIREMDEEINELVLELVMSEIQARHATRLLQAKYPFRAERERILQRGKENEGQATNGRDKPTTDDKAD
jgi:hypothetical protein